MTSLSFPGDPLSPFPGYSRRERFVLRDARDMQQGLSALLSGYGASRHTRHKGLNVFDETAHMAVCGRHLRHA